jgi:solute carrier family 25 (mitochondrial dicarboxylate transporter), member 10
MLNVMGSTISQTGFRSLYTGLSASVLRQMTYSLTRLGTYEKIKEWLARNGHSSTGNLLVGAMVAGGVGGVAGNPAGMHL